MALVVLLRGVNVGGHRNFRPTLIAEKLNHLDTVNIGANGTFVIRKPVPRRRLREEFARLLPFESHVTLCDSREITRFISRDLFAHRNVPPDVVRFVSVLSRRSRAQPPLPLSFPSGRNWLVKVLGREDRFVFGLYRRRMKVIGYLGELDRLFGVPVTTRNWKTMTEIAKVVSPVTKQFNT